MTVQFVLFIIFAVVAAVSAVMMVTRRNPVISALFLVLNFGALAGLYLTLNAQFIAVVQVIVYAGAIMVLFLFVIMLLLPDQEKPYFSENPKTKIFAIAVAGFVLVQFLLILFIGNPGAHEMNTAQSVEIGTVEYIGSKLYTTYLLPFEAIAFVLLVATVGALILAKRKID